MSVYSKMSKEQLSEVLLHLQKDYENFKSQNLKLDMSRGKPNSDQLDLSSDILNITANELTKTLANVDTRNYGILDGVDEAKQLFADVLDVKVDQVIVGGSSSLNLMYDMITKALLLGVYGGSKPWGKNEKIKFLCPTPGYDRHFVICEQFGIEMINVEMDENGPDMDFIENAVANDEMIKGIWCVPKYSNPQGITYTDDVVKRFANLSPKADDFRVFWDNAYYIHDIDNDGDELLNILAEAEKTGKQDMFYEFFSTSKITFAGSGVAVFAASKNNIDFVKKQLAIQTIGYDKINQVRHCKFFKTKENMLNHMQKHAQIIKPKFDCVIKYLNNEIAPLNIGDWVEPKGGYFISFDSLDGCAKRIVSLCKEAGVVLTGAGATYPYGKDPDDKNIRIAPTFPPVSELEKAMELFCLCVKIASAEKLIAEN